MSPRWRVGRSLGRTLYLDDKVIGMVDTPELASDIVAAMNEWESTRNDGKPYCDDPDCPDCGPTPYHGEVKP
jgi:hypothetical protein